jgi:hypothetical protein
MSQTSSQPTTSPSSTVNASTPSSDPVFANAPILALLELPPEGATEEQIREQTKQLRLLRTSAPALRKVLDSEESDGEEVVKTTKKKSAKKNTQAELDSLLKSYGV